VPNLVAPKKKKNPLAIEISGEKKKTGVPPSEKKRGGEKDGQTKFLVEPEHSRGGVRGFPPREEEKKKKRKNVREQKGGTP